MRRGRKMWKEIAEVLEKEHGLKTSHKTIQNFFKRAQRIRKEGLPLGWEDPESTSTKPASAPAQPAAGVKPGPAVKPERTDAKAAIEALRAKSEQENNPTEDPEWDFSTDKTKPI